MTFLQLTLNLIILNLMSDHDLHSHEHEHELDVGHHGDRVDDGHADNDGLSVLGPVGVGARRPWRVLPRRGGLRVRAARRLRRGIARGRRRPRRAVGGRGAVGVARAAAPQALYPIAITIRTQFNMHLKKRAKTVRFYS